MLSRPSNKLWGYISSDKCPKLDYHFENFSGQPCRIVDTSKFYHDFHIRLKYKGNLELNLGDTQQWLSYWGIHWKIKLNYSKGPNFKSTFLAIIRKRLNILWCFREFPSKFPRIQLSIGQKIYWIIKLILISTEKSFIMESVDDIMQRVIQVHDQWFYEGRHEYWYYLTWGQTLRGIQAEWKD